MLIFHDVPQNSDAWQALRLGKATASNFGSFMANAGGAFGEPAKRYALQLALERLTGIKAEHSFSNEHMERGHEQEPVARIMYEEDTFSEVTNGGFFDCGEYGDSPDGLIGFDGVLEIKSVTAPTHYATIRRGSFDPAYRWQLIGIRHCFKMEISALVQQLNVDRYTHQNMLIMIRRAFLYTVMIICLGLIQLRY